MQFLQLHEIQSGARFKLASTYSEEARAPIAVSNIYGYVLYAIDDGFGFSYTRKIREELAASKKNSTADLKPDVVVNGPTVSHIRLSCDELNVLDPKTKYSTLYKDKADAFLIDILPNPGSSPSNFAALTQAGEVVFGDFDGTTSTHDLDGACICWSRKGKQLAVGTNSGQILQVKPDGTVCNTVTAPDLDKDASHISTIAVLWLEDKVFVVVYEKKLENELSHNVAIVSQSGTGQNKSTLCLKFEDPSRPYDEIVGRANYYLTAVRDLSPSLKYAILIANSFSPLVGVLGKQDGEGWVVMTLEETHSITLPLDSEDLDTMARGFVLDTTSQDRVSFNSVSFPPPPIGLILNNDGCLLAYQVVCTQVTDPSYVCPEMKRIVLDLPAESVSASSLQAAVQPSTTRIPSSPNAALAQSSSTSTPVSKPVEMKPAPPKKPQESPSGPVSAGGDDDYEPFVIPTFSNFGPASITSSPPKPKPLGLPTLQFSTGSQSKPTPPSVFGSSAATSSLSFQTAQAASPKPVAPPAPVVPIKSAEEVEREEFSRLMSNNKWMPSFMDVCDGLEGDIRSVKDIESLLGHHSFASKISHAKEISNSIRNIQASLNALSTENGLGAVIDSCVSELIQAFGKQRLCDELFNSVKNPDKQIDSSYGLGPEIENLRSALRKKLKRLDARLEEVNKLFNNCRAKLSGKYSGPSLDISESLDTLGKELDTYQVKPVKVSKVDSSTRSKHLFEVPVLDSEDEVVKLEACIELPERIKKGIKLRNAFSARFANFDPKTISCTSKHHEREVRAGRRTADAAPAKQPLPSTSHKFSAVGSKPETVAPSSIEPRVTGKPMSGLELGSLSSTMGTFSLSSPETKMGTASAPKGAIFDTADPAKKASTQAGSFLFNPPAMTTLGTSAGVGKTSKGPQSGSISFSIPSQPATAPSVGVGLSNLAEGKAVGFTLSSALGGFKLDSESSGNKSIPSSSSSHTAVKTMPLPANTADQIASKAPSAGGKLLFGGFETPPPIGGLGFGQTQLSGKSQEPIVLANSNSSLKSDTTPVVSTAAPTLLPASAAGATAPALPTFSQPVVKAVTQPDPNSSSPQNAKSAFAQSPGLGSFGQSQPTGLGSGSGSAFTPFGQMSPAASAFGKTETTSASPSAFGQTSAFTAAAPSAFGHATALKSTPSAFGQTSTVSGAPAFNQAPTVAAIPSAFGQSSTLPVAPPAFGQTSALTGTPTAFGQPSSLAASQSAFGKTSAMSAGSAFGQNSSLTAPTSAFGLTSGMGGMGISSATFGQSSAMGAPSAFGQATAMGGASPAFGGFGGAALSGPKFPDAQSLRTSAPIFGSGGPSVSFAAMSVGGGGGSAFGSTSSTDPSK
ncbi:hypothetical protein HDU97_009667 [Phlyctochytrium planicorne]|nr:hypothetical protein HDU97_009667 [Phlyctochytrium planicorne]